jgi:hypothetical protein
MRRTSSSSRPRIASSLRQPSADHSEPDTFRARLKLVPFNASFVGRRHDAPDRLSGELPSSGGWWGAADYWEAGRLANCAAVDAASAAYFKRTRPSMPGSRALHVGGMGGAGKGVQRFQEMEEDRGEGVPSTPDGAKTWARGSRGDAQTDHVHRRRAAP